MTTIRKTRITKTQKEFFEKIEQERIPGKLWENTFWGSSSHHSVKSTPYVAKEIRKMIVEFDKKVGTPEFNFGVSSSLKKLEISVCRNMSQQDIEKVNGGEKICMPDKTPQTTLDVLQEIGYDKICALILYGHGAILNNRENFKHLVSAGNNHFETENNGDCESCIAVETCPIMRIEHE